MYYNSCGINTTLVKLMFTFSCVRVVLIQFNHYFLGYALFCPCNVDEWNGEDVEEAEGGKEILLKHSY